MTPPIEPEVEPLTDKELTALRMLAIANVYRRIDGVAMVALPLDITKNALATIDRLTRERDEALRVAARGVSFKGDAQDTLRWMNRAVTAERQVEQLSRVVEAVDAVLERSDDPGALRKAVLRPPQRIDYQSDLQYLQAITRYHRSPSPKGAE